MKGIIKTSLILFAIAVITSALLSVTHKMTLEPIAEQKEKTRQRVMKEVLDQADAFEQLDTKPSGSIVAVYEGFSDGESIGYVIQLSPRGYSGNIDMMVGISSADQRITGMRVMKHSETPGLGALAVREDFYSRYDGKALAPLTVVKGGGAGTDEIDAITSATITTKAITEAVNEAIDWVNGGGGR